MVLTRKLTKVEQKKETCRECKVSTEGEEDKAVKCDICNKWICLKCSGINEAIYDLASKTESDVDFICRACKVELPRLRELITLKQKQDELEEKMNQEAETNKTFREQQQITNEDYNRRIEAVEKVIQDKKLADEEFPPLSSWTNQAQSLRKVIIDQKKLDEKVKQQSNTLQEDKRREDKQNSLIVYGVPENQEEAAEQMKEDFETVRSIYESKVDLHKRDLLNITRLGKNKTTDTIRPIKLVFASSEKRLEILRNNKNLTLTRNEFPVCTSEFCDDHESNHKHIYVSPDKTKQQREEEKKLRDELKTRRLTENNLIIRDGKIIKKSTIARWVNLRENVD